MTRFKSSLRVHTGVALIVCVGGLIAVGCSREPTTPEAKRQRGDEIVRRMSDHLARAQTISAETTDSRPRVRAGKEVTVQTTRQFTVRRPDRFVMHATGDIDLHSWYDGTKLTMVSTPDKVWARVNAAATLDDTFDRMAEKLDMPLPTADFFYASPYDALIGPETTGGYVGRETIDGVACVHVAYEHPAVDWELWIPEKGDPLPKRFRFTDKTPDGPKTTEIVFNRWSLGLDASDATFAPEVPADFERVPLVASADDEAEPDTSAAPAEPGSPTR